MKPLSKVYNLILDSYPFLTKNNEELSFKNKASLILNSQKPQEESIKELLSLLNNKHATIKPVTKNLKEPNTPYLKPSFIIENENLILLIHSWSNRLGNIDKDLIKICTKNQEKYKRIIIDLRNNQGGNSTLAHNFAGIFLKDDVNFGRVVKRITKDGLKNLTLTLRANRKIYIDKPLILLISNKCFSSTELFIAPFKVSKRALLVGSKTAGGSANPTKKTMHLSTGDYEVRIPTWRFFLKGEKRPIEETAIEPDIIYNKSDLLKFSATLFNINTWTNLKCG